MIKIRKAKGLTQSDLADLIGVKKLQVHHYEAGNTKIDLTLAEKIAEVLGADLPEMLGFKTAKPETTAVQLGSASILELIRRLPSDVSEIEMTLLLDDVDLILRRRAERQNLPAVQKKRPG